METAPRHFPLSPASLLGISLAFLLGLNTLAYLPARRAPFVFDDISNIVQNAEVRSAGKGLTSLLSLARPRLHFRRPLADLSFALNLRLFGPDPASFHAVNLCIHLFNAALLFLLLRKLLLLHAKDSEPFPLAPLISALLWSLHPVQTFAVSYIVQRMTSLAALFYLLALLAWIYARTQRRPLPRLLCFAAAVLSAALGFLVKESLVTLPLTIALWELLLRQSGQPLPKRIRSFGLAAALLAGYALTLAFFLPRLNEDLADNITTLSSAWAWKLFDQPRLICHYLALLILPLPSQLSLDPQWTPAAGPWLPGTTIPAVLLLAAILLALLRTSFSRPLPLFLFLTFLLTLLPESFLPKDLIFYHRLYLPSAALLTGFGLALSKPGPRLRPRLFLTGLVVLFLFLLTLSRNRTFADDLRLFQETVKKAPANARGWANLAAAYQDRGLTHSALRANRYALRLNPGSHEFALNLARLYFAAGELASAHDTALQALALKPDHLPTLLLLGQLQQATGQPQAALEWYQKAHALSPEDPETMERLAKLYLDLGRPEPAREILTELLRRYPNVTGIHFLLGNSYLDQARWAEAAAAFARELRLNPDSAEAANSLGVARLELNQPSAALPAFQYAVELAPAEPLFHLNLCTTYLRLGQLTLAEGACRRALALDSSLGLAWQKLGEVLLRQGKRDKARAALQHAIQLLPSDPQTLNLLQQAASPASP